MMESDKSFDYTARLHSPEREDKQIARVTADPVRQQIFACLRSGAINFYRALESIPQSSLQSLKTLVFLLIAAHRKIS